MVNLNSQNSNAIRVSYSIFQPMMGHVRGDADGHPKPCFGLHPFKIPPRVLEFIDCAFNPFAHPPEEPITGGRVLQDSTQKCNGQRGVAPSLNRFDASKKLRIGAVRYLPSSS